MTVFVITLLPVLVYFMLFFAELAKQREYKSLCLAVLFLAATASYHLSVSHILVTGQYLFPYSEIGNRVFAACILPTNYWLVNISLRRSITPTKLMVLYIPAGLLLVASLIPDSFAPVPSAYGNLAYNPLVHFSLHNNTVGWSLAELVLLCQSMFLIARGYSDYSAASKLDMYSRERRTLLNYYVLLGIAIFIQAGVGCSNWMQMREYAIVDFCFNSFVMSRGLHVLTSCFVLKNAPVVNTLAVNPVVNLAAGEEENQEEVPAVTPSRMLVDFAGSPEIPREEMPEQVIAAPMPTSREILISQLKNALERDRLYLRAGLRIDEVAMMLGTNRTYLTQMVKDIYGSTFAEQMNIFRIKSAREDMLRRPDASIENIALSNGFNSSNTFTKVFNQHVGCSPAVWRRTAMNKS